MGRGREKKRFPSLIRGRPKQKICGESVDHDLFSVRVAAEGLWRFLVFDKIKPEIVVQYKNSVHIVVVIGALEFIKF